jgi:MFS family permease
LGYPDKQPSNTNRKNGRNLWRFHGDAAVSAVDDAAVNYQAPSIIAAGADVQSISVLTTLVNLCLSLICIKAPALIERIGTGKSGAITLAALNLFAWVPLIIMFFLAPAGISPGWIALLWLINIMPGMLLTFQRDNWLSNLVPGKKLGRYMGQRLAIKSAFYLGAFCFLGYMLDSFGNTSLTNFAFVFIIALVVALVDFIIFNFMYEPREKQSNTVESSNINVKFGIFTFVSEIKAKKLDTFIVFTSLFYLTVGLSGPLYAVYVLQDQYFSYLSYTIIIASEYLARVISAPFWGRYADRSGNIRVLSIVSRIIPAIPICWLFCSNIGYLAVIQTTSGICWGAFDLCTQNYIFKVAPQEKKLRYIVYTRCLILFSTALGGIGGVYLIRGIFPIFSSTILTVFLISGLFRALVVLILMPKLIDMAMIYGQPLVSPKTTLDNSGKTPVVRHGLFYHREKPPRPRVGKNAAKTGMAAFTARPHNIAHRQPICKAQEQFLPILKNGMIELPEGVKVTPQHDWLDLQRKIEKKKQEAEKMEINPRRRPWLHNEDVARSFHRQTLAQNMAMQTKTEREKSSREGLFYNSDAWSDYKRASLKTAMLEAERLRDHGEEITPEPRDMDLDGRPGTAGTDVITLLKTEKRQRI